MSEEDDEREKEIREAQLADAIEDETQVLTLAELLKNEGMRDFLWRVLTHCRVFQSTFNRNFGDMALAEGQRSVGVWLLSEIAAADPDALLAMQTKANHRAARERAQARKKALRRARSD